MNNTNDKILYSLTHPQMRIWYIEKIYPDTSLYNIGGPVRVKGDINFNLLEESINRFINKNEGVRLRFIEENGEVNQYVGDFESTKLDFIDFSRFEAPEAEFNKWVEKEAKKPFVLENERLFYFALFKISDNDNGYMAKFHHIISDGWSVNIMTEQICDNYMKLLNGEEIDSTSDNTYIGYIENEKKYLLSDRFSKNKLFWNEKFNILPNLFLNKSSDIIEGKRKTFELDLKSSFDIKKFTIENRFSLNTFFVTLYLLYKSKTTLQKDIVIGTPVLNRSGKKEKSMFGMFTSSMPFRYIIDDNKNILETMANINEQLIECYFNQKYPYNLLVQDLDLKKKGFDNLFNTCVNYYNTRLKSELNGFPIENVEFYNGNQIYSLQIVIKDWSDSGKLLLDFDYKINDFSDEQIDEMYNRLLYLASQIIADTTTKIADLGLLTHDERKNLVFNFNSTEVDYPKEKLIYNLFEEQVEKTPHKVAISFNNNGLTYKELNEKANQLARYLINKGITEENIVGLLTTHSIETVIGILGTLKAGAVYLPIDPSYPKDRISYMLEDSGTKLLLTNLDFVDVNFNGQIVRLDEKSIYSGNTANIEFVSKPSDLVYVIYTSGSTGKPKGTMIEHQGLVNYIWWAKKMYVKDENEVFPLYSSLAFDLTVTSIFTPLISGSRIIVYDDNNEEDEYVLYRIMKDNKVTVIKLTPSHLSLLKELGNIKTSVRRFIVGGEDLKVKLARDIYESFGRNIEVFNEYGPTETVVGCMIHKYDYESDTRVSVPIGIPADNVQIYILDNNLNPVLKNTVGEMYISGDGVARGYLNRTDLTNEKFIGNPFMDGKRMYRTGDLARFLDNDKIEYAGRADYQVKIRGYRIELGEIEKHLLNHEAVKDAVVIDLDDKNNSKFLCAYIVKKADVIISNLREYLLRHLPDYMVPMYFIEVDEIPLTINGKVNRELLPIHIAEVGEYTESDENLSSKEKILIDAICNVLNIEKLNVKQNFYHLGGDSIKAIQVASKLNSQGFKIKVKDILSNPIIKDMSLCVEQNDRLIISQELREGSIKPTPIMSWFFSQNFVNPNHYNQSILLELKNEIEIEELEIIFKELIMHHDSLRINYNSYKNELFYNSKHLNEVFNIEEYDLTELSASAQEEKMILIADSMKSSLNIKNDLLIKACVFKNNYDNRYLLVTAHHLVVDGISWRIIIEDLNLMIKQVNNGQAINLPSKTHSYQEWAEVLEKYSSIVSSEEGKYWNNTLNKEFNFPTDYDIGLDRFRNSETISFNLEQEETELLVTKANISFTTEPKELLLTSLLRTIKEFTRSGEIVIELEGHGREDLFESIDISRTVGWFTSIYPFYIKLESDDLPQQIKKVKEEIRKIPNKGIGFGILNYLSQSLSYKDQRHIRFNYLGDFTDESNNDSTKLLENQIGREYDKDNKLTSIIEINCFKVSGKLNFSITYSKNKFSESTMERFAKSIANNLIKVINYCCNQSEVEFTPSDFDTVDLSQDELESLFT